MKKPKELYEYLNKHLQPGMRINIEGYIIDEIFSAPNTQAEDAVLNFCLIINGNRSLSTKKESLELFCSSNGFVYQKHPWRNEYIFEKPAKIEYKHLG